MSSQARSASGGVRNLRAMFETKDDSSTSPPLKRGRSPGPSIRNNGDSPRQLSKVQTNFVAVERNGETGIQWGLKIEKKIKTPDTPTMAGRRGSFSMHEETDHMDISERKKSITDEFQARKDDVDISETIPECAVEAPFTEKSNILGQKVDDVDPMPPTTSSTGNPDKMTTEEEPNTRLLPGNPTISEAVSGGKALTGSSGMGEDLKGISTAKLKPASPAKAKSKVTTGKTISKPAPIATNKPTTSARSSSKPSKSPVLPKTPVTPGHSVKSTSSRTSATAAVKTAKPATEKTAKPATEKATKPPATTANAPKPNGKPSGTSSAANPAVKKPALPPASTGFVKPKPRSPTRPAKLPSSLTAPTSSSLSKTSSSPPAAHPVRRPIGAASSAVSTTANNHAARSSSRPAPAAQRPDALRKTASHTRPSLGPPPSTTLRKQPSKQSLAKPSAAPADEGFLARMMRPTTASASKTHEKGLTPPKTKVLPSRPSTRNGHHAKLESHGSPVGKSHVAGAKAVHGKPKARKSIEKVAVPEKETASEPAIVDAEPEKVEKTEQPTAEAESAPVVPAEEQVTAVEAPAEEEVSAPAAAAEESVPAATGSEKADVIEEAAAVPEPATQISEQSIVTDKIDVPEIMEEDEKKEHAVTEKIDVPEIMAEDEKKEHAVTDKIDVPEIMEEDAKKEEEAAEAVPAVHIDTSEEAKVDGVPAVETPAAAVETAPVAAIEPDALPIDVDIAQADVEKEKLEVAMGEAAAAVKDDVSVEKSVDHIEDVEKTALSS